MSDEAKRIVADQTWRSVDAGHDPVFVETTKGERFEMLEEFERIAACAPEALRMLRDREWTVSQDGDVVCSACGVQWGGKEGTKHAEHCGFDALMRKAGLR